jgi:hypothetical protein
MIGANDKILVSVDTRQKERISLNGSYFYTSKEFNNNLRESNPVLCIVVDGNRHISCGTPLLVHHSRFVENSPHHVEDNIYSLEWNESIFAKLDENGEANSVCDNIIVDYVLEEKTLLPEQQKKPHKHKYRVKEKGFGFNKGQYVFAYDLANYEIVYVWKGIEKRVVKLLKRDIVAKSVN